MTDVPILSIVIPTRDRYEYLLPMLDTLLRFPQGSVEIVVSDNTVDNAPLADYVKRAQDARLVYVYTAAPLTMHQNCELALDTARGEYVCMLGDDDGILEWAPDLATWMAANGVDCALGNLPIYRWPVVVTRHYHEKTTGYVVLRSPSGRLRTVDVQRELRHVARDGGTQLHRSPRVYQGVVRRTCLAALKANCGTYFPGPSPDIANAVGLCQFVRTMVQIDVPLIVSGTSPRSAGGKGSAGAHVGELESVRSLPPGTVDDWDPRVPRFWSGPTIWAEGTLKALKATHSAVTLNFPSLYANSLVFHWNHRKRVWDAMAVYSAGSAAAWATCAAATIWNACGVVFARARAFVHTNAFRYCFPGFVRLTAMPTIRECTESLHERYRSVAAPWRALAK